MFGLIWNSSKWLIYAALATAGLLWLRSLDATVQIAGVPWLGSSPRPLASVLILLGLLTALIALLYHGYRRLWMLPRQASERAARRRQETGIAALSRGLVALAAGDADEASRQARTVESNLSESAVARLIAAQSAQLKGDEQAARQFFTDLLADSSTRFLGLRGLITQGMKRGDHQEALALAREARSLQPKSKWLLEALFELESKAGNVVEAEQTVREQRALAHLPASDAGHKRAVLLTQQAANALAAGDSATAVKCAKDALALDRNLPAARLALPKAQLADGQASAAASSIEAAWKAGPMTELVDLYLAAKGAPEGKARADALERLAHRNEGAALSHILRAELAIEAEDWTLARQHLDRANSLEPSERGYKLLAAVEQALTRDVEAIRTHLTRAIDAKGEGSWTCSQCDHSPEGWVAICPSCGSFDSIGWVENAQHTKGLTPRLLVAPPKAPLPVPDAVQVAPSSAKAASLAAGSDSQVLLPAEAARPVEGGGAEGGGAGDRPTAGPDNSR